MFGAENRTSGAQAADLADLFIRLGRELSSQNSVEDVLRIVSHRACAAIDAALLATYNALVAANGTADVAAWTASTASRAAGVTMPVYDEIESQALGLVGQPAMDWQNRPTFQQVIEFPRHQAR